MPNSGDEEAPLANLKVFTDITMAISVEKRERAMFAGFMETLRFLTAHPSAAQLLIAI